MGKGLNTTQIRKYFKVLRNRPMLLHGYFILGNIGETVDDMGRIVPFAHELGVDTLALSMLRNSPYSGLEELIAENPAYHIADSGKVYSDHCSLRELRRLRRRLYGEFYTLKQVFRVAGKGIRFGGAKFAPGWFWRSPVFGWRLACHYRRRARRRAKRGGKHPPPDSPPTMTP